MAEPFLPFDPAADIRFSARNLPHWDQPGATCFITFRTADSLPASVLAPLRRERDDWLRARAINPSSDWKSALALLPNDERREFQVLFTDRLQELLDDGHGACVLKRPELASIVADGLKHFDGVRYRLGDFVVMPNHVHLLVRYFPTFALTAQCSSWKRYTAKRINDRLGRRGAFWQDESFDHLVRSAEQFEHLRRYIAENPRKAGLRNDEYLLWRFDGENEAKQTGASPYVATTSDTECRTTLRRPDRC